jgi:hypothetical protein
MSVTQGLRKTVVPLTDAVSFRVGGSTLVIGMSSQQPEKAARSKWSRDCFPYVAMAFVTSPPEVSNRPESQHGTSCAVGA